MKILTLLAILCFSAVVQPVLAKENQQQLIEAEIGSAPADFNFYIFSISWSPTYCEHHQQDKEECGGKFPGFSLHGLWPMLTATNWPQNCSTTEKLTPEALAFGKKIYPNKALVKHEWEKHGTCSGLDALSYFKKAENAVLSVKVPPVFQNVKTPLSMSATKIVQSFISSNPVLKPDNILLECANKELTEVRFCMDKNSKFEHCVAGFKTQCPSSDKIVIPAYPAK